MFFLFNFIHSDFTNTTEILELANSTRRVYLPIDFIILSTGKKYQVRSQDVSRGRTLPHVHQVII